VALREEFLRQHYLDQFFGSSAFRAELSAFVVPADGRLAPHLLARLGRCRQPVKETNWPRAGDRSRLRLWIAIWIWTCCLTRCSRAARWSGS